MNPLSLHNKHPETEWPERARDVISGSFCEQCIRDPLGQACQAQDYGRFHSMLAGVGVRFGLKLAAGAASEGVAGIAGESELGVVGGSTHPSRCGLEHPPNVAWLPPETAGGGGGGRGGSRLSYDPA